MKKYIVYTTCIILGLYSACKEEIYQKEKRNNPDSTKAKRICNQKKLLEHMLKKSNLDTNIITSDKVEEISKKLEQSN